MSKFNKCKQCNDVNPESGWVSSSHSLCNKCAEINRNSFRIDPPFKTEASLSGLSGSIDSTNMKPRSPYKAPGKQSVSIGRRR